jgi:hypothetical protein
LSLEGPLADLEIAVDDERPRPALEAARRLRDAAGEGLADRHLEPEDPLLEQRRRLHHRLEVIEAKVQAGRFADAADDLDDVAGIATELARAIDERDPAPEQPPGQLGLRRVATIAGREIGQRARAATGLAVLVSLVLVLGLEATSPATPIGPSAWAPALDGLLALAALGGAGLAAGTIADDVQAHRLPLVAGHGLSRSRVAVAKFLGVGTLLGLALAGPLVLTALGGILLGRGLALCATLLATLGFVGLGWVFAALVLAFEARGREARASLLAGVLAYVLAGPVWRSAFLAGDDGAGLAATGAEGLYLASPLAAARRLWHTGQGLGLAVLAGWLVLGVLLAARRLRRHGWPTGDPN